MIFRFQRENIVGYKPTENTGHKMTIGKDNTFTNGTNQRKNSQQPAILLHIYDKLLSQIHNLLLKITIQVTNLLNDF